MKTKLNIFLLLFTLLTPSFAETPLALVTELSGIVKRENEGLELLEYLHQGDKITVASGGKLGLSYVKGGARALIEGPCTVRVLADGPVSIAENAGRVSISKSIERVGYHLPEHLDLGKPGAVRRGELSLHVSRQLLPGVQEVRFSAIPNLRDFELTVSDANSFEEVYSEELSQGEHFTIPEGVLKSGESYRFSLASSGGGEVETEPPVVVLSTEPTLAIEERLNELQQTPSTMAKVELLAIYKRYHLDQRALVLTEELLAELGDQSGLKKDRIILRKLLQYSD